MSQARLLGQHIVNSYANDSMNEVLDDDGNAIGEFSVSQFNACDINGGFDADIVLADGSKAKLVFKVES